MAGELKSKIEEFLAEGHTIREVYSELKLVLDARPAETDEFGRVLYKAVELFVREKERRRENATASAVQVLIPRTERDVFLRLAHAIGALERFVDRALGHDETTRMMPETRQRHEWAAAKLAEELEALWLGKSIMLADAMVCLGIVKEFGDA
jgi:hypothetical protein